MYRLQKSDFNPTSGDGTLPWQFLYHISIFINGMSYQQVINISTRLTGNACKPKMMPCSFLYRMEISWRKKFLDRLQLTGQIF